MTANIGSLVDQLEQLGEGEGGYDPLEGGTIELPGEEEDEQEDLQAILAKLAEGEDLDDEELEALEGFAEGLDIELVTELVDGIKNGEQLSAEELELLRSAIEGNGKEFQEAEQVTKAIVAASAGSLLSVDKSMALPLLSGLPGLARGARCLVRKRFASSEQAAQEDNRVRLFEGSVQKDLPASLELMSERLGGESSEDLEDGEVLQRAVDKIFAGLQLTEEEMAELLAANLKGQALGPSGGLGSAVHKTFTPLNRARPVESFQETIREVRKMIGGERENVVLNHPLRAGQRRELVHKSLRGIVGALFGQRQ